MILWARKRKSRATRHTVKHIIIQCVRFITCWNNRHIYFTCSGNQCFWATWRQLKSVFSAQFKRAIPRWHMTNITPATINVPWTDCCKDKILCWGQASNRKADHYTYSQKFDSANTARIQSHSNIRIRPCLTDTTASSLAHTRVKCMCLEAVCSLIKAIHWLRKKHSYKHWSVD